MKKLEAIFSKPKVTAFFAAMGLLTFIGDSSFLGGWISNLGAVAFVINIVWTIHNLEQKIGSQNKTKQGQ